MLNLLSAAIITSTFGSMFFYWASAKNKWMKIAYLVAITNGVVLIWINWALAQPNRVPEIYFSGVRWTTDTSATNFFSILCVWMVVSGIRGLLRLKKGKSWSR